MHFGHGFGYTDLAQNLDFLTQPTTFNEEIWWLDLTQSLDLLSGGSKCPVWKKNIVLSVELGGKISTVSTLWLAFSGFRVGFKKSSFVFQTWDSGIWTSSTFQSKGAGRWVQINRRAWSFPSWLLTKELRFQFWSKIRAFRHQFRRRVVLALKLVKVTLSVPETWNLNVNISFGRHISTFGAENISERRPLKARNNALITSEQP